MSRKIEIQILGDSKSLEAALGRAQQKTSRFGSAVNAGAKVGAAGLLALGAAAKIGFDELVDAQRVQQQTAAVLKSTGGAANVTAGHVNTLSQKLLQLSGVDDETIASGENLLLTFRNIRNEAGKGNDVFDQATKATLDLSVAMGEDMHSAALQVGKALNDPIRGLTALKRVGVQFNDAQTATIQKLVETGHTAEAQRVILRELNKEFGGSAAAAGKTLPAALSRLRESFADASAQVVSALMPSLLSLVGVLTTASRWMTRNKTATTVLVGAIAGLSAALVAAKVVMSLYNSSLFALIRSERVAAAASKLLAAGTWLVNAALDANPVVLIAAGVIALGVALVIAYRKSATFRQIVHAAMSVVGAAVDRVVGNFQMLYGWIQSVIGAVQSLISWLGRIHVPHLPSSIGGIHIPGLGGGILNSVAGLGGGGASGPAPSSRGTVQVNLILDGHTLARQLVRINGDYARQNGRSIF